MNLRDRVRRWWSPAQWQDDHPAEREQQEQPKADPMEKPSAWAAPDTSGVKVDRDFKKSR